MVYMKKIYLIGGTMGVGKTTVCQQLKLELKNSVLLDGDWCWDANPFQVTEETKSMVIDNICHLLNNFIHCSAYDNVIFCWVMHDLPIIDTIIKKLAATSCDIINMSRIVDANCLQKRLLADIEHSLRNADVIDRSIKRIPLYQKLNTIKIDTCNKSVQTIIDEIKKL